MKIDSGLPESASSRVTEIEDLILNILGVVTTPAEIRELRVNNTEVWQCLVSDLITFLDKHLVGASEVGAGKRYVAFLVGGVIVKFLIAKKLQNASFQGECFRQTKNQQLIFDIHKEQHGVAQDYLGRFMPDTLFVEGGVFDNVECLDVGERYNSFKPHAQFFMIQETVFEAASLDKALSSYRAELRIFREELKVFYESIDRMNTAEGKIPEVIQTRQKNLSVSKTGRLWLIDSNNLINSNKKKFSGSVARFLSNLEETIENLESGLLPANPQG